MIRVGVAGWTLYGARDAFPGPGSQLERFARVLGAVEINSAFYRPHSCETYARWAASTPTRFRFAVKVPQAITHEQRLRRARAPLAEFLDGVQGLGRKLGPLLVQLPPSLAFEARVARRFFALLRDLHAGPIACEPRHASWFEAPATRVLVAYRIGRVAADPAPVPEAATPGGWPGLVYYRLHGSPRRYWSVYEPERLAAWARQLRTRGRAAEAWCIFDNTAGGGATRNALELVTELRPRATQR